MNRQEEAMRLSRIIIDMERQLAFVKKVLFKIADGKRHHWDVEPITEWRVINEKT